MEEKIIKQFKTTVPFPLLIYKTNITYNEVRKASGIAYILLDLMQKSKSEEKICDVLRKFGIPSELHYIFGKEIASLLETGIVQSRYNARAFTTANYFKEVKKLILTCSGGPFFGMDRAQLEKVTKADALKHPNWKMGAKITIDCATLMNKGLEVIEAMRLYDLPLSQVDVVIHRQSIIHSLVEFRDGAVMAQLGVPDMRVPIRLAMTYPHRVENPAEPLDLFTCGDLTFHKPDEEAFPCLALAKEAALRGGTACAVMNGANEAAVALFLEDKIGFYDIPRLVRGAMDGVPFIEKPDLTQILNADKEARALVGKLL